MNITVDGRNVFSCRSGDAVPGTEELLQRISMARA